MAFALTKFNAHVLNISSASRERFLQRAVLTVTASNTDTALDLGTNAGTFWTAAIANTTYGAMASNALEVMKIIGTNAKALAYVGGTIEGYHREESQLYDSFSYTSVAGSGGGASAALTVTGLLATDTIVSVQQKTAGSNSLPLLGWTTVANDALTFQWSADPGAGSVVVVTVKRTSANAASSYKMAIALNRPNFTFVSGGAPTSNTVILEWDIADETYGVTADLG